MSNYIFILSFMQMLYINDDSIFTGVFLILSKYEEEFKTPVFSRSALGRNSKIWSYQEQATSVLPDVAELQPQHPSAVKNIWKPPTVSFCVENKVQEKPRSFQVGCKHFLKNNLCILSTTFLEVGLFQNLLSCPRLLFHNMHPIWGHSLTIHMGTEDLMKQALA